MTDTIETKLRGLLGEHKLTVHDVGTMLRYIAELMDKVPRSVIQNVEYGLEDADRVVDKMKELGRRLMTLAEEVDVAEQKLLEKYEETYANIIKKRGEIERRLKELPPLPQISFPYNIKEFIDIVERVERMTPEQFDRLKDLCHAMMRPEERAKAFEESQTS